MANKDAPKGFRPLNLKEGDVHKYYKSASVALGVGDPVIRSANSTDPLGYPSITRATTGAAITGVVVSIDYNMDNLYKNYLASGDTGYVHVADNPNQRFLVQDNGGASGLVITQVGQHIDSVAAIDCSTITGISNYEIDTEAVAADNTWVVEELWQESSNSVGANALWVVKPNLHTEVNNSVTNVTEI